MGTVYSSIDNIYDSVMMKMDKWSYAVMVALRLDVQGS